jgi:hypothetical protein
VERPADHVRLLDNSELLGGLAGAARVPQRVLIRAGGLGTLKQRLCVTATRKQYLSISSQQFVRSTCACTDAYIYPVLTSNWAVSFGTYTSTTPMYAATSSAGGTETCPEATISLPYYTVWNNAYSFGTEDTCTATASGNSLLSDGDCDDGGMGSECTRIADAAPILATVAHALPTCRVPAAPHSP